MEGNGHSESVAAPKDLFRIGEVSRLTSTKPFVLRFWETEFPMLQPVKSPKGHRLYRREDIETVFVIKRLLYDEGFTIAGARRHLRDHSGEENGFVELSAQDVGVSPDFAPTSDEPPAEPQQPRSTAPAQPGVVLNRRTLLELRDSLRSLLTVLESE